MAYEEKYIAELPHNIVLEGRKKLSVSGVEDVESYDEETIIMGTSKGTLVIKGHDLQLEKLSLDSGEIIIEGNVDCIEYEDDIRPSEGFFSRLFK